MSINLSDEAYRRAVSCLKKGGVVAYPTEGVYGLGCDPTDEKAIQKIIELKERPQHKGLIIIAANEEQIKPYLGTVPEDIWTRVTATWPGPYTWILPVAEDLSPLISGQHESVAVRVTAHPQAHELCRRFGGPIVSTSANKGGQQPATNNIEVYDIFGDTVDYILPGRVGNLNQPTTITDALSGKVIRS